jgi:hypothetical protein
MEATARLFQQRKECSRQDETAKGLVLFLADGNGFGAVPDKVYFVFRFFGRFC